MLDHSHLPSAQVKNKWNCICASPVWLQNMHRENFIGEIYPRLLVHIVPS